MGWESPETGRERCVAREKKGKRAAQRGQSKREMGEEKEMGTSWERAKSSELDKNGYNQKRANAIETNRASCFSSNPALSGLTLQNEKKLVW
jgi:hypothetical protein